MPPRAGGGDESSQRTPMRKAAFHGSRVRHRQSVAHSFSERLYVRRYWILLACLFVLLLAGAGTYRLRLASNYEVYFDKSNPQLRILASLQQTFSRNDNILFVLAPVNKKVFSPEVLAAVTDLTQASWQLPFAARVDSVTNFQRISSTADEVSISALVGDEDVIDVIQALELEARALAEPALVGRLISPTGDVTGVNVRLQLSGDTRLGVSRAADSARALAERIRTRYPQIAVYLTGNAMLNAAFPKAGLHDLTHLTPVMYLIIFAGMLLLLRCLQASLVAFCVVIASSLVAMGLAGWTSMVLSSASVAAPTIISTVAIADSVHLLTAYLRALGQGANRVEAFGRSLHLNFKPVVLTSLTTAIGFLSMNFSDVPPFRDLGNITAVGVVTAVLFSLVLLPVLLFVLPPGKVRKSRALLSLNRYAEWIIQHQSSAFWVSLVVVITLTSMIGRVQFNDAFVEYFDKRVPFRQDTDFTMQHLTGIYQVEYAIEAGAENAVMDPVYLQHLDAFDYWLNQQAEVMHVSSITRVLKRLNQHVGDGRYALPENRQLSAQYLLLYEMSVPYGLDLNARLSVDRSISRVTITLRNLDNQQLRKFESRAEAWLKMNTPAVMHAPATGAAIMFAYIAERNILATFKGAAVAIVVIALVLLVLVRNVSVAVLSLIPNLVPVLMAFGLWALFVGQMGVALVIVATMSLGIVVDDTIHLVTNFAHARNRLNYAAEDAIRYAFQVAGSALVTTTVILVLGFAVLSLSSFQVNHGMGQLLMLVIVCALLADFLMLPGLLLFTSRRGWV